MKGLFVIIFTVCLLVACSDDVEIIVDEDSNCRELNIYCYDGDCAELITEYLDVPCDEINIIDVQAEFE